MIKTFKVGEDTLEFKMTNKTVFDIDEKFDNFGDVFNGLMFGKNIYNNALKIIVCSCISKRFDEHRNEVYLTIDELISKLTPEQIMEDVVAFATNLYLDYRGVKKSKETDEDTKKK